MTPLFVCHANCARSVLAQYLYQHLCKDAPALSAGVQVGSALNSRVEEMLRSWRIDARAHRPRQLERALCDQADGIFVMSPAYVHRLIREHGSDLAAKTYLFADPFTMPLSFSRGEYRVSDPSFDSRPVRDLLREYSWLRERVLEIRLFLLGHGRPAIPASDYWDLLEQVDPYGH